MKKKIVIFEFQDIRYASRARKEAFSLAKKYEVTLVGFNKSISSKKLNIKNGVSIIEFSIPFPKMTFFFLKIINIFFFNISLLFWFIFNKQDVYHLHNLKPIYPALIAKSFFRSKLIYDAHELHIDKRAQKKLKQKILMKFDYLNEARLIKEADIILQASQERAEYFAKYYKTEKPLVIENFANFKKCDIKEKKYLQEMYNLSSNTKIIMFTGFMSIGGNQRIDNSIRSLQYLDDKHHFFILGIGTESIKQKLINIAEEVDVKEQLHFVNPVPSEKVVFILSQANVAIIPIYATSLNSRFSALNKVSQSLMAGLPIACSNYENLERLVLNNPIGLIGSNFNVENPQSISKSIINCLSNEKEYKKNALLLAKKYLNWEKQEKKLFEIYNLIQ